MDYLIDVYNSGKYITNNQTKAGNQSRHKTKYYDSTRID